MTTDQALTQIAEALKTDLINSLQTKGNISGQSTQQVTITKTDTGLQLQLPAYLAIVENGRGPTSKDAVPGNPPMIQRIQQWCREKGIDDKLAWAIKKKIDKMGYPGKPGLISEPLGTDNINKHLNDISSQLADSITAQILNAITL